MTTTPIAEPVTGRQALGDLDEPIQALAQFYRAFNNRDLALMADNWDNADDVAMDNPLGGIVRGWPEIRAVYERIFSGRGRVQVEFHDYTVHRHGDVFYAVGRERGTYEAADLKLELAIRTSRVFRRVNNRWRQAHHHGSIDDPRLLDTYRRAVR